MTYYKVLNADNRSCNGGNTELIWSLPTQGEDGTWIPGEWMPEFVGELEPCLRGYHLTDADQLLEWLNASIYEAEPSTERIDADDKIVCRSVRLLKKMHWDDRVARLFACDCAERVLPLYEKQYPDDHCPRHAIEVARLFAEGKATVEKLCAAWDAAWAAARAAAGAAAWAAARAAAGAATGDAAGAAAWDAAGAAAWDAAGAAAWDAAGAAAWDAERTWQIERLMWYLGGEK